MPFAKNAAADGDLYLSQPVSNSFLVLQKQGKTQEGQHLSSRLRKESRK